MKRRTLVQTCARWLLVPLAFIALMALGAILDLTVSTEQAMADDAVNAVTQAKALAMRDDIARRMCTAELGPGTQVIWTVEGDLVCRPAPIVATKGGAL